MRSRLSSRLVVAGTLATALLLTPATAAVAAPLAPGDNAPVSGAQVRTSVTTPNVVTDPGYALNTAAYGSTIRWNPCKVIHYRVNDTNGGAGALADVTSAVSQLESSSGLQFVYDGPSADIPQATYGRTSTPDSPLPLLIAWAAPGTGLGQSNLLSAGGEVGDGGWAAMSWTGSDGVARPMQIVSGFVVLKAPATVAPGFGPSTMTTRGRLLLHELGHAVGLNHTSDPNQVMYPTVDGRAGTYATGDQAGLSRVGALAGCVGVGTPLPVVTPPPVTPPPAVDPVAAFWQWLITLLGSWFPWI